MENENTNQENEDDKNNNFILGSLQKQWIESLKNNPERQLINYLGKKTADTYKACCLGEYLLVCNKGYWNEDGFLTDSINGDEKLPISSFKELGLFSSWGCCRDDYRFVIKGFVLKKFNYRNSLCLSGFNDHGITWPQIAEIIEKFPQAFFNKSL